jgi:hypothetical protein
MTEIELGDAAFDVMDRMLEDADFRRGVIVLYSGEDAAYCHTIYTLKTKLREAVTSYMQWKYKKVPKKLEEVIENIVEEYDDEIRDSFARDMRPKVFTPGLPQSAKRRQPYRPQHRPPSHAPVRTQQHSEPNATEPRADFPKERPSRHRRVG